MASLTELQTALVNADAAGDAASAKALATHIKWLMDPNGGNYKPPSNPAANMPAMDPSAGGGTLSVGPLDTGIKTPEWLDRGLAGAGQAVYNTARGVGQMVGAVDRKDVGDARALDAPLDATTAGKVGNFAGNAAIMAVPTILAPAAAGGFLARTGINAAAGAGLGLAQPSTSTKETMENIGLGTLGGGLAPAIGQGVTSLYQGGKSLVEPFFKSGQDSIAARTLNAFAGSPSDARSAATAMRTANPLVAGVTPTAGMVAGNGGVAQLQRTIANNPDFTTQFANRNTGNANALIDAIQGIAGTNASRASAIGTRSGNAKAAYQAAYGDVVPVDPALTSLLQRPAAQDAIAAASKIAKNDGWTLNADAPTVKDLHYVKLALDDMIEPNAASAIGRNASRAVTKTRDELVTAIDAASPNYAAARAGFASDSAPINSMDVGNALLQKLSPALNDVRDAKVLNGNSFANAVRDADATAQKATGFNGATMGSVLSPADLSTVGNVQKTLGQISDAQTLGAARGSPTAQNLVSQNMLRQIAGPLGLPESFVENTLMQSLARPVQFVGQMAQPRITNRLGQAMLDPKDAAGLMLAELNKTNDPRLRNYLARALLLGGRTEAAALSQ